jgi:predicted nucleic acid-binding protein
VKVAVDTSVLLDVLGGDPVFGGASREALRRAYDRGPLCACEVVWAEVRASFEAEEPFLEAMDGLGIEYLVTSGSSAALAGAHWRRYHGHRAREARGAGRDRRVVADFLVGAHAQLQADGLLARDRGFFRSYFRGLRLIQP